MTIVELCLLGLIINMWYRQSNMSDAAYNKGVKDGLHAGYVDGRQTYDEEVYERGKNDTLREMEEECLRRFKRKAD